MVKTVQRIEMGDIIINLPSNHDSTVTVLDIYKSPKVIGTMTGGLTKIGIGSYAGMDDPLNIYAFSEKAKVSYLSKHVIDYENSIDALLILTEF
jgi:hypothetical protein